MFANHNDIVNALISECHKMKFQRNLMEGKIAAIEQEAIKDGDTEMHDMAGRAFVLMSAGEWIAADDVLSKMLR